MQDGGHTSPAGLWCAQAAQRCHRHHRDAGGRHSQHAALPALFPSTKSKVGEVWGAGSMAGDSAALEPDPRAEGLK